MTPALHKWSVLGGGMALLVIAVVARSTPAMLSIDPWVEPVTVLLALTILAVGNYWLGKRDVLYPGFLYAILWLAAFGVYTFCPIEVKGISSRTELLLVAATAIFSLGSFAGAYLPVASRAESTEPLANSGRKLFLLLLLAILPFFVLDIANLAGGFGPDFLARARLAIIDLALQGKSPYSNPLTSVAPSLAVLCALAAVLDWKRSRRWVTIATVAVAFTYAVLTTGRPQFVQLAVGIPAIWLFRQPKPGFAITVRRLAVPLALFLALVASIPLLTKAEANSASVQTEFAGNLMVQYVVGNIPALDTVVLNRPEVADTYTYHSIAVAVNNLRGLPTRDLQGWFVSVPFPMNTYTAYRPYLFDFGLAGVLVFAGLIGLFHGYLYRSARSGRALYIFLFAVYLYPMVMTIFDDQYTGAVLAHHIQIALFCGLYFGVFRDLSIARVLNRCSALSGDTAVRRSVQS